MGEGNRMRKVTVFVGSPRRSGATWRAARKFLDKLESVAVARGQVGIRGEIVVLGDYKLGLCRGCKLCCSRGEELCPLKDDRDALIEKMEGSDGVVFASPNYSFQVPAAMKLFLDRLGFLFHRPRFHGKAFTSIVVQAIFRGGQIVKYLDFLGGGMGFQVVKGSCSRTLEPMNGKAQARMEKTLEEQGRRFHAQLLRPTHPAPSLLGLMVFRMARTNARLNLGEAMRDHTFFRDGGLFQSDYYYPTRLGPFKKAAGAFFDWVASRMPVQRAE
jgi:multimeric flavodoxin WrbA